MPITHARRSAELTSTHVERYYRAHILSGNIAAGTKLPSNQELARAWASSTMAIQRALSTLASEGLIERKQRRGTFVRDACKQTYIGILIGSDLVQGSAGFYRRLCSALRTRLDSQYLRTRVYDNLTFVGDGTSYAHGNFLADRKNYPFKGYILIGTSNVSQEGLGHDIAPRAVFQDCSRGQDVLLDYNRFVEDSLKELTKRGFQKIVYFRAVLSLPVDQIHLPVVGLKEAARGLGISEPKMLSIRITGNHSTYEREVDRGISDYFNSAPDFKRNLPDAFLVQDDVSVRPLVMNLLRRGVRIPKDVAICAEATTESDIYYGVPIFRYEFPMSEIARHLCDILASRFKREGIIGTPRMILGKFLE